jgi:hypothetical protein
MMMMAGTAAPPPGVRPYEGVPNSPCTVRTALNVSWYDNWEQTEHEACADGSGGGFVPMIGATPATSRATPASAAPWRRSSCMARPKCSASTSPTTKISPTSR